MDLINQLKADGTEKGLCRQWRMKLQQGMSVGDLAKLYIEGIDFCISEDYPTLDFLRKHFKGSCEPYGVFVDDEVKERNAPDVVLNGDCKAILEYDGFTVSRIFARHNSQGAVNVSDHAIVTVDLFDNSNLAIATAGSDAQVIVNLYGNVRVGAFGSGIVVNKFNKFHY
ncbi:MAG: hypothetical protein HDS69_06415 [Bacteroidales bacterium]|nr:hypothetical protein [Bacteroidales bacterium]